MYILLLLNYIQIPLIIIIVASYTNSWDVPPMYIPCPHCLLSRVVALRNYEGGWLANLLPPWSDSTRIHLHALIGWTCHIAIHFVVLGCAAGCLFAEVDLDRATNDAMKTMRMLMMMWYAEQCLCIFKTIRISRRRNYIRGWLPLLLHDKHPPTHSAYMYVTLDGKAWKTGENDYFRITLSCSFWWPFRFPGQFYKRKWNEISQNHRKSI